MSGGVHHLALPLEQCNQACIDRLEKLLEKARSGQITSIHGIAEHGGNYFVFSTRVISRHEIAGMLLEAAIERLKDDE